MRKSHKYNELSDVPCPVGCGRMLKQRMVEQKEHRPICFECYQAEHNLTENPSVTAKQVRTGKVQGRKKGIYGVK